MTQLLPPILGIAGFAGFEALRVYKRVTRNKSPYPQRYRLAYALSLMFLAIFAAVAASLMAPQSLPGALFIGFSVPNGVQAFAGRSDGGGDLSTRGVLVDDVETTKMSFWSRMRDYFD